MNTRTPPSVSASIHIYRGLMDRAVTWRHRIDSPTNWAITTGGTVASFSLNDSVHSHVVLLLVMALTFAFLVIEARRMRYYDLWASWVRVIEIEYLVDILRHNRVAINQPWEAVLVHDMVDPHYNASNLRMIARRLRDNYLVLYFFLLVCWLLKLLIHQPVDQGFESLRLIERASIGPIDGVIVISGVALFYVVLVVFTIALGKQNPSVELQSPDLIQRTMLSIPLSPKRRTHTIIQPRPKSLRGTRPLDTNDWD